MLVLLVVDSNVIVLTFSQSKELNEVFSGDWLWAGIESGTPISAKLLVFDDVCHNVLV